MRWVQIYDGAELEVYSRKTGGSRCLAVTFDYAATPGRPPHIPAADFFEEIDYDQIHITSKQDIWYQTLELFAVAGLINAQRTSYDRVISYGNSMGAYGAMLISGLVDVDKVLAFAPQFSVDPAVCPDELRWRHLTGNLNYIHKIQDYVSQKAIKYVVYDPFWMEDKRHIRLFRQFENLCEIRLPFSGHFPASYLYHLDLLKPFMRMMIFGMDADADLRRDLRRKRRVSGTYYFNLAQVLMRAAKPDAALRAAHIGYSLAPGAPEALIVYAAILAFDPQQMPFAHIALRLLKERHPTFGNYDGMRDDLWNRLSLAFAR